MTGRRRQTIGVNPAACDICGAHELAVVESRRTRGGLNVVNPMWRAEVHHYELCRACGVKYPLHDGARI